MEACERREFDWVVDLDDPLLTLCPPQDDKEEEEEDTAEEAPLPASGLRHWRIREFLVPVLLALAYISAVSGARWWLGE